MVCELKKVAFATLKGGTGKTITAFNISGVLAEKKKVLMIDCDPQCNLSSNAGVDITDPDSPSIRDVFEDGRTTPESVTLKDVIEGLKGLDIIPSSLYLIETEMNLISRSGRESLLSNWFSRNEEYFSTYDYLVIDTNPSMGLVNQNVFVASDIINLVTDVGFNSILGAQAFIYLWGKRRFDLGLEDNIKSLIINNSDKRIGLAGNLKEFILGDDELKELLVLPEIPARVLVKQTEGKAMPVNLLKKDSDAEQAYRKLIKDMSKKGAL